MNILVPDSWLREFLITKATPQQIKEYLSLCGPSVERMHEEDGEFIYDIEVTGNRPDSMSIVGIAREAAAILPRFEIAAKLQNDPYSQNYAQKVRPFEANNLTKKLVIKTDPILNPRWTSVVMDNVKVGPSPVWLQKRLEATGIRSLNTIVDVTNYIMRAYGQPVHAFDYDQVLPKNGVSTMILRASKKGERVITLDGKTHILPGDDIVIEDGSGRLIDLCGIMGAQNSSVKSTTKTIVLFMQTYEPTHIRKTSMSLAHRTEAADLFEKGLDPELVLPSVLKGIELIAQVAGGKVSSKIYDIYPKPYKSSTVSASRTKSDAYIGKRLKDKEIADILKPLGFQAKVTKDSITVTVPSFRRDVTIDVDIIEELARIYGYHNITSTLPDTAPPVVIPDQSLSWEEEIKVRLRDWGYTETYTYSMISEELMDIFGLDKSKAYKIANPLSNEWVYMRPSLWPSMLSTVKQNMNITQNLRLFELSMVYDYRRGDLPDEKPVLLIAWTGDKFYEAKGLAEAILDLLGIGIPAESVIPANAGIQSTKKLDPRVKPEDDKQLDWYGAQRLSFGSFGSIGLVHQKFLDALQIHTPVTILELDVAELVKYARSTKQYIPIPKYPASYEDLAFVLPPQTPVGPMIAALKSAHSLVSDVSLLDQFETTTTFHITYLSLEKNLTTEDIRPIREKLIAMAQKKFNAQLKTV
ncbi:MAG: phenylalanine--tRNA ligase subunit beta [Candidatus Gottesmanbacteria bacterium]|nr:phenylalanine--tRNA ligase subunit beta [Candidatus Gottesmanbacteria bacterium]